MDFLFRGMEGCTEYSTHIIIASYLYDYFFFIEDLVLRSRDCRVITGIPLGATA